jgi:hypothetical protein
MMNGGRRRNCDRRLNRRVPSSVVVMPCGSYNIRCFGRKYRLSHQGRNVVPRSPLFCTLIKAILCTESSVLTRTKCRHIPEDIILQILKFHYRKFDIDFEGTFLHHIYICVCVCVCLCVCKNRLTELYSFQNPSGLVVLRVHQVHTSTFWTDRCILVCHWFRISENIKHCHYVGDGPKFQVFVPPMREFLYSPDSG